jgi:putative oligomerization/nucleic acid binding protein
MLGGDRRQRRRRVAAVGGAAMAAKKHRDAKQAQGQGEAAPQETAPPESGQAAQPAASDGLTSEALDKLKELGELHEQNVLSDEEFEREKAKVLGTA